MAYGTNRQNQRQGRGLVSALGENGRQLLAAAEARSLGRCGIKLVSEVTGVAFSTIDQVLRELDATSVRWRLQQAGDGTAAEAPGGPSGACRAGDAEVEIRSGRSCGSQRVATILRPAWGHRVSQAPVCLWNSFPDNWLPAAGKREDAGKRCTSRLATDSFPILVSGWEISVLPGAGNLGGYQ